MIRCPKCHGIGRTISTRSNDDAIFRWHKCDTCGLSFTSTQNIDLKYCDKLKSEYIESIIDSKDFKTAIKPLFSAFNMRDRPWSYQGNQDELISILPDNNDESLSTKFIINVSVNKPNVYGLISIITVDSVKELISKTLIGQIQYNGNFWSLNLDLATINKLITN